MDRKREILMQNWVRTQLNDSKVVITPLSGDASFRSYLRAKSQEKSFIIMNAPPEQEDERLRGQPRASAPGWAPCAGRRAARPRSEACPRNRSPAPGKRAAAGWEAAFPGARDRGRGAR